MSPGAGGAAERKPCDLCGRPIANSHDWETVIAGKWARIAFVYCMARDLYRYNRKCTSRFEQALPRVAAACTVVGVLIRVRRLLPVGPWRSIEVPND